MEIFRSIPLLPRDKEAITTIVLTFAISEELLSYLNVLCAAIPRQRSSQGDDQLSLAKEDARDRQW